MTEKGYTYPWEEIPLILNVNLCGNVIIPLKKENINSFLTFSKIKRAPTKVSALKTQTPEVAKLTAYPNGNPILIHTWNLHFVKFNMYKRWEKKHNFPIWGKYALCFGIQLVWQLLL